MKISLLVLALVSSTLMSACGSSSPTGNDPTQNPSSPNENGNAFDQPDLYFDAFVKHATGSCDKTLYVTDLNSEELKLMQDSLARDVLAGVRMYMNPDHTFEARYYENTVTEYMKEPATGYFHSSNYDRYKVVRGTWSVKGGEIVFEHLGRGSHGTYNGNKAIFLQFTEDQISPNLAGKSVFVRQGYSSWDFVHESDPCAPSVTDK